MPYVERTDEEIADALLNYLGSITDQIQRVYLLRVQNA